MRCDQVTWEAKKHKETAENIIKSQRNRASQAPKTSHCGKKPHPKAKCPAKEAMCRRCQRKGHYSAYCYTKLEEISVPEESSLDSAFLNTVENNTDTSWITQIKLNGHNTVFKLDTGAEVSAVTQDTYQRLGI